MDSRVICSLVAVSYTHLVSCVNILIQEMVRPDYFPDKRFPGFKIPIRIGVGKCPESVSYTHLDVYKRQAHSKGCRRRKAQNSFVTEFVHRYPIPLTF